LRRLRGKPKPLVLTDGLFSRDGELAPLAEYLKVLPTTGMILLDDAHAAGMIGATGKGTVEYAGVPRQRIIQTVTLSKAFGCYGGAILCGNAFRERILARSPMFAGATPVPLPLVNAALKSMELLRHDAHPHTSAWRNCFSKSCSSGVSELTLKKLMPRPWCKIRANAGKSFARFAGRP
jgi:8-amino-7-oxononanoate synthase